MDKKIVLVFGKNGSLSVISGSAAPITSSVAFLSLVFALGVGLNAALAMSLCGSPRRTALPTLLMHVALANALDCLFNVPVSALFVARWPALAATRPLVASTLCRANAATFHGATILQGGLLAALGVERAVTLSPAHPSDAARRRSHKVLSWLVPGVVWTLALALVIPVAATDVAVRYHRGQMACAATRCAGADLGFPAVVAVLGLAVPGLVTLASACKVVLGSTDTSRCQRVNALMAALVVGHVLLATQGFLVAFTQAPLGSGELTPLAAGEWDAALAWIRYLSLVGTPLAALAALKPARKRCELGLCCCRGNAVSDPETLTSRSLSRVADRKPGKSEAVERKALAATPVLFATAEGLHLRVLDEEVGPGPCPWVSESMPSGAAAKYRVEFCDVSMEASASRALQASQASRASPGVAELRGRASPGKQVHFSQDLAEPFTGN